MPKYVFTSIHPNFLIHSFLSESLNIGYISKNEQVGEPMNEQMNELKYKDECMKDN